MSKIIIGIHGLGNKPPHKMLEKWWLEAIREGLKNIGKFKFDPKFELVYWADILNDKPLNNLILNPENPYYLDEPYTVSPKIIPKKKLSTKEKFLGFLEEQMDKIFLNDDLSPNFEFISDIIFKKYFLELEAYYAKQPEINDPDFKSVKELIRNRLAKIIRKHKNKDILLIGHSMGSIIAYDVCSFVEPEIKIDTLATIGSPLGMQIIISKIAEETKKYNPNISKLRTPKNITHQWQNFSDLEDKVALNYNLADDYEANKSGVKVKDNIVKNNYCINGESNPHKSFGYLRSAEFSNMIANFIEKDESKYILWFLSKKYQLKNFFIKILNKLLLK